jgi:hypothetical protein
MFFLIFDRSNMALTDLMNAMGLRARTSAQKPKEGTLERGQLFLVPKAPATTS